MNILLFSVNKLVPEEKLLAAVYKGDAQGVAALLGEADTRHPLFMGGKLLCTACNVPESKLSHIFLILVSFLDPFCPKKKTKKKWYSQPMTVDILA